jgi:hypothetical protein
MSARKGVKRPALSPQPIDQIRAVQGYPSGRPVVRPGVPFVPRVSGRPAPPSVPTTRK